MTQSLMSDVIDPEDEAKFGAFNELQQEMLQEKEDEVTELKEKVDKNQARILELEKMVADLKQELDEKEHKKKQLEGERDTLSTKVHDLIDKNQKL